jgi:serine protease AprX
MANKLIVGFALLLGLSGDVFSQYSKYWIQFTDKNNSPYTVANSALFLSPRALQRRVNQMIPIVQNDVPVTPAYIDSVRNVPNVTMLNRSKWFNAITISTTDTNALNTIKAFPFVNKTEPVKRLTRTTPIEEMVLRNESAISKFPFISPVAMEKKGPAVPTPYAYTYGNSIEQVDMLGGVCMHNQGYDGKGMVIAILDVGFDNVDSAAAFDSLIANNQILGRRDFVDQDTIVSNGAGVHGTWCLSLMAANIPGTLIGTAPKAMYWLLRTEDGPTENVIEEDNWVSGAEFADSVGADVLSTSLGYTEFDSVKVDSITNTVNPANHTYAHMDGNTTRISIGTDIAASKGMLPVCAAGNMGTGAWHFIGAPADADSVLAVGAVDSAKTYVGFSSKGPSYDGRVKPNVAAQGGQPYTTDLGGGAYNLYSGTSFACPLTAGMVACLWQAHPTATNMQLFNIIQQTASQSANPDTLMGYGIPDFCAAHLALGIIDHTAPDGEVVNVYPNPFLGSVSYSIQSPVFALQEIEVINILGEIVFRERITARSGVLNLSSLPSGVFVIHAKGEGRIVSAKLVKH